MKSVTKHILSFFLILSLFLLSLSAVSADLQTVSLETTSGVSEPTVQNTIEITSREIPGPVVNYELIDQFRVNQYDIPQPKPVAVETEFVVVQKPAEPVVVEQTPIVVVQAPPVAQPEPVVVIQQPVVETVAEPQSTPVVAEVVEKEESFVLYAVQKNLTLESCHVYEEKVTVHNNGETLSTYHFSANGFIADRLTLSQQDFTLSPGQSTVVTLTLSLECGLEKDTSYELTLDTETLRQTFTRNLEVYTNSNIDFTILTPTVTSCSCENETIPFTLQNSGTHMENYSFYVSDYTDSLYQTVNSIILAPNETYEGELQAAFCGGFGERDFAVTVETQYSGYEATQQVNYTVDACADFTVTLPTQVDICRFSDEVFTFNVKNDAAFENDFLIDFTDDANIGSVEDTSIFLNSSQSSDVLVSLKARDLAVGLYNMTVAVRDEYAAQTKSQNMTLSVTDCYNYRTVAKSRSYDICPVVESIPIFIENTGLYEEDFHFTYGVDKKYDSGFYLDQTDIKLAPGENKTLILTVNGTDLPRDKNIPFEFMTVINSTQYRENVLQLTLKTQSAQSCYGVSVSPHSWKSQRSNVSGYEQLQVTLANDGLRPGTYNLSLVGNDLLALHTNQVTFSPGQSVTLNISNFANATTLNQTYYYELNITTAHYEQVENISLNHNARPIWLYVLGGILLLVILVLLLLYAPWLLLGLIILGLIIAGVFLLNPTQYFIGGNETVAKTTSEMSNETEVVVESDTTLRLLVYPQKFYTKTVSENETATIHAIEVQNRGETDQELRFHLNDSLDWINLDLTKAQLSPNESVVVNVFAAPNGSVENKTHFSTLVITTDDNQSKSVELTFKHNGTPLNWNYVAIIVFALLIVLVLFILLPFWFVIALLFFIIPLIIGICAIPYAAFNSHTLVTQDTQTNETTFDNQELVDLNETLTQNETVTQTINESQVVDNRLVALSSFLDNKTEQGNNSTLLFIDQNTTYELNISNSFTDPDEDDYVTYRVDARNISNMSLTIANEILSIQPDADYIGYQTIQIVASDGKIDVSSPDIHLVVGPKSFLDSYRNPSMVFVYLVAIIVILFILFIIIVDMTRISKAGKKKRVTKRKK